jgi:hypothetical protein
MDIGPHPSTEGRGQDGGSQGDGGCTMMVRAQWRRQQGNMGVGKREDQHHSMWQSGGVVLNVRRRHERASLE